jgi:multicomponent Na+:H+ antiporter subunit F
VRDSLVVVLVSGALVAMGLGVVRLWRGPTQADRIVALDVVFSSSIALSAAAAVSSSRPLFLDVGIGLSIIGFVATVLWARLIDKSPAQAPVEGASARRDPGQGAEGEMP